MNFVFELYSEQNQDVKRRRGVSEFKLDDFFVLSNPEQEVDLSQGSTSYKKITFGERLISMKFFVGIPLCCQIFSFKFSIPEIDHPEHTKGFYRHQVADAKLEFRF